MRAVRQTAASQPSVIPSTYAGDVTPDDEDFLT